MFSNSLIVAALAATGSATRLYVSSYDGNITSLDLGAGNSLSITSKSTDCGYSPSWLTMDSMNGILYCMDEGNASPANSPLGSVNVLKTDETGILKSMGKTDTIVGPVSAATYGGGYVRGLAVAHYGGHSVSWWMANSDGSLAPRGNFTYSGPNGTNVERQTAPFEHQAVLDPTAKFIIVPDLGSDLVRVFSFDENSLDLKENMNMTVPAGSGPRHAAFRKVNDKTFMYLVAELANTVTSYEVTYPSAGKIAFSKITSMNTFGGKQIPKTAGAGEIAVTPDLRFLIVSNRNDASFMIENYDPKNSTLEASDSLATYELKDDGSFSFLQLSPAGGLMPRHFSINQAGDRIAVGLQKSSRVVILERDVSTGKLGVAAADVPVSGEVTCVVWDESVPLPAGY
ncbi:putative isomerase YbhE [Aulographum hederae CBS 113979]|uniref:Putative isomerase YbhE n=1 Tax=Aulographum hederae CBS 113979 TaxID=1176131 RepID=A0A6G1GSW0_9PEZI|nr:putative isomerase YbhE [Aulographum hederae CBS 113979]